MRSTLFGALTALLLVTDSVSARIAKRSVPSSEFESTIDSLKEGDTTELAFGSLRERAPAPVVVVTDIDVVIVFSTVTMYPVPATTATVTPSVTPSGISWSGYPSGSGSAYPTGQNHTSHHNHTSTSASTSASTSFPVFSLTNTGSSPAPTTTSSQHTSTTKILTTSLVPSVTTAIPSKEPTTEAPEPVRTSVTSVPFLRGVNLGGWLVLERWMVPEVFTGNFNGAADQYSFDSINGAAAALEEHWSTYFTESDIKTLAATGINALRIPIGYWAYDNTNTPYLKGADVYLEKAIEWARKYSMYVWVDCHGSPGSQNGFDNSGKSGNVAWQTSNNLDRSISVLQTMAQKYGSASYADVVVGLELVNEPISWGANDISVTRSWAKRAQQAVRDAAENKALVVVMHDAFQGAQQWMDIGKDVLKGGPKVFGVDSHLYQVFMDSDNKLTQAQHITEACSWSANLATANAVMPTFVGEWSAATNICVNPDGSTIAGGSCSTPGCQCSSANFDQWNDMLVQQTRRFVEAQLDVFESSTSGYFMWSAKGPGGWGFLNGIQKGVIPNPVTARKYPGQCGSGKRRMTRGTLGASPEAF